MTWTLLHEDCEHQEANAVVQRCQSHPEETDSVDEHGLTPLHLLCISNPSIKALSTLLKTNINVLLTKDQHGDLPIHIALRNNLVNLDAIAMMIQSCPSSLSISNKEGLMPLHICCRHSPQRLDLIEMIAKRNPKSCHAHTKSGYLVVKRKTNNARRRTTHNGTTGASSNNHSPSQQSVTNQNLLHHDHHNHFIADANVHHQKSTIDLKFHENDVQIRDGSYPLHMAVLNKAPCEVIQVLIELGGSETVLFKNKFGQTPYQVAEIVGAKEDIKEALNPQKFHVLPQDRIDRDASKSSMNVN